MYYALFSKDHKIVIYSELKEDIESIVEENDEVVELSREELLEQIEKTRINAYKRIKESTK